MLDFIRTLTDAPPQASVRFSDQEQDEARQRRTLLEAAQQEAQACLRDAREQADALRQAAFQEGFEQGVVQAATDIAYTLIESQRLTQQRRDQLASATRQLLGTALHRDDVLDDIIGQWLSDQTVIETALVEVMFPRRCQSPDSTLIARLRQRWCTEGGAPHRIRIEYHDRDCYLIRLADQVLEFDVDAVQTQLSPSLLATVEQMPQASRQLTVASQKVLSNLLDAFVFEHYQTSQPDLAE